MPSEVIRDFHYDDDSGELTIWFTTGRTYVYESVPADVSAGLDDAFSRGRYFNKHIRNNYRFRELMPAH